MAIVDVEGIVTKETKYGDSSRILTVITKSRGKISVLAGNVRRKKSGLLTATSLFSHSRFTLFKGGASPLYKLNEGELLTSFPAIKDSLEGIACAAYLCDITNYVVPEELLSENQAELLLRSLYMLNKDNSKTELIKAVFEFRTLVLSGLTPNLRQCGDCGDPGCLCALSPHDGAVYCKNCADNHPAAIRINDSILSAIAYITLAEEKKIFSFAMSPSSLKYLSALGELCIEVLLDKKFKTLDYLHKVMSLT